MATVFAVLTLSAVMACNSSDDDSDPLPGDGGFYRRTPPEFWLVWIVNTWDTSMDIQAPPNSSYSNGDSWCAESARDPHPMPTYPPYVYDSGSDKAPIPVCVHRETYLMMTNPEWRDLIVSAAK